MSLRVYVLLYVYWLTYYIRLLPNFIIKSKVKQGSGHDQDE